MINTQWPLKTIAKLFYNSKNYGLWYLLTTKVFMGFTI